jgi:hypothetical protein
MTKQCTVVELTTGIFFDTDDVVTALPSTCTYVHTQLQYPTAHKLGALLS